MLAIITSMERPLPQGAADMRRYCPALPDRDKHSALLVAHREMQDRLSDIFTPTFSHALDRIGNTVACDPRKTSRVAYLHPLKEAPYTILPPDFPSDLFSADIGDPHAAIRFAMPGFWRQHEINNSSVGGLHDASAMPRNRLIQNIIDEYVESGGKPRGSDPKLWDIYTRTDAAERAQNYATLSYLAADFSDRVRWGENPRNVEFLIMERRMIDRFFTYQYPTAFHQYAAPQRLSSIIRFPLSPEMDREYADRLTRAAGFIIGYLDADPEFADDCAKVSEQHGDFIKQWMLRAQDKPEDLPRVGVRSLEESVGRAVLPVFAELGRGFEPSIASALPAFVDAGLADRVTSHSPLGYIGPVALQGQGTREQIVEWDGKSKPTMRREALQDFDAAVREWRSDYHYLRLMEEIPDERTGLMCPFWNNVVPLTARLILHVAGNLDPQPIPAYNMTNPYRPEKALLKLSSDFGLTT